MWEASKTIRKKGIKLSVALHPGQVLVADFYAAVDRVNLMTYDMITEKGSHHSTIRNTKAAVKVLADSGCPKSKIVVGIPAYGIHGKNPGDVKTYSEIVDALLELDPNLSRDDATQRKSWKGYLFDSPSLVAKKAAIAKEEGLMGVFFWELGQDKQHPEWSPGGMLLETAAIEISGEASDSNTKTEL